MEVEGDLVGGNDAIKVKGAGPQFGSNGTYGSENHESLIQGKEVEPAYVPKID